MSSSRTAGNAGSCARTPQKPRQQGCAAAQPAARGDLHGEHFSLIATDSEGVIQIFNVGAERMLGDAASDVIDRITPASISDPGELLARAQALTTQFLQPIAAGFEALVFKVRRGIEDIYELNYVRRNGKVFPAVVSVTALRDASDGVIGYLLIGTDNSARREAEQVLARHRISSTAQLQRFRTAMDSTADAIMLIQRSTMKFIEVNATAQLSGPEWIIVGTITDVTERIESARRLHQLAYYDTVTGLPNRRFFNERLSALLLPAAGSRIAVLYIDACAHAEHWHHCLSGRRQRPRDLVALCRHGDV